MLVQLQKSDHKRPGHLVGTPAAVFTFSGPADSLWRARRSGAFSRIHEICPGSHGNSNKTQGREGTGCPLGAPIAAAGSGGRGLETSLLIGKPAAYGGCSAPATQGFFPLRPRRSLRNRRSWRVLAGANRRDCLVRIPNCFCRSFHLSRNDGNASKIVARDPFASDNYSV